MLNEVCAKLPLFSHTHTDRLTATLVFDGVIAAYDDQAVSSQVTYKLLIKFNPLLV